jgi:long-chain acyl-CoA synthetase
VEDSTQLEKVLKIRNRLPHLRSIVMIEGKILGDGILTLEEFQASAKGAVSDFVSRIRQIPLSDLATLVYTSGTTGPPKGVMLSHKNIATEIYAVREVFDVSPDEVSLAFLPLAHILARVIQFYQLATGFEQAYAESIDKLIDDVGEVRPHIMVSVPRIFEKIYTKVRGDVESAGGLKKTIFDWAREVGMERSHYLLEGRPVPFALRLRYALAHQLVFSKLHKKLGGRIRFFVSGGAPLAKEIAEFFHAAGLMIYEGYGLTETTAAVNLNLPGKMAFGTVGNPLPGVEEKIAPDGEILVRGGMITQGYWKNPQATQEVIDKDGWFHTGDVGEFTPEGLLRITDRKKDIIVTAGGKNIAPQNIENLLKTDTIFSHVVVHGDRRKYLTAVVTLNIEEVKKRAQEMGIEGRSTAELAKNPKIFEMVKMAIEEKNQELAKYETIKRFAIIETEFSIDSGELTPTLKVKRKLINERYKDIFDSLYSE